MLENLKHDILSYQKDKFYTVANKVDSKQKIIIAGWIFVHGLNEKEIWISSGTGYEYFIEVPTYMQNVVSGSQFNVSFPYKETKIIKKVN